MQSAAPELTQRLAPGLEAEILGLLEAKRTPAVKRKLAIKFDAFRQDVERKQPVAVFEQHFKDALGIAAQDPVVLYRFFQMYNFWNAGIASCIAGLVNNIGGSYETLIDPKIEVRGTASYAFEVARWVNEASKDEYADPKHRDIVTSEKLSHRMLAAGLVEGIGNYANLTVKERNAFEVPNWLTVNIHEIQTLYGGKKDNVQKIAQGLGMHFWSEYSADAVEFSNACRMLFVDRKGEGLDQYFTLNPNITIGAHTFPARSWLWTHGGWDEEHHQIRHGVEYVHLATGFYAGALLVGKAPAEQKQAIQANMLLGIDKGRKLIDGFFVQARQECEKLLQARQAAIPVAKTVAAREMRLSCG